MWRGEIGGERTVETRSPARSPGRRADREVAALHPRKSVIAAVRGEPREQKDARGAINHQADRQVGESAP